LPGGNNLWANKWHSGNKELDQKMAISCPVCGNHRLEEFLRRDAVPVHQNLLFSCQEDARQLATGQLTMVICEACNFVFNQAFDASLLSYGERYDNSQNFSPAFEQHVNELVDRLVNEKGVRDCTIVEVGCGKGEFLRKLAASEDFGNRAHGFDPAYIGPDVDGRVTFHRRFYTEDCARIRADVVISRHVIEHIPQPKELLANIRAAVKSSPKTRVFFETPCVEWILKNQVAWDFFYEHCSLFTKASLARAFEESGFRVRSVDHVFEGQYLWLEAIVDDGQRAEAASPAEMDTPHRGLARLYGQMENQRNASWKERIRRQRQNGPIALWGAGAKGVTFANLIDPAHDLFACIVDVNPNKQGRFLAGTGHPIIAPSELKEHGIQTVIVLNPNYCSEIRAALAEAGIRITVVDLMREGALAA
jgi:SAM-dependent methyltransferase